MGYSIEELDILLNKLESLNAQIDRYDTELKEKHQMLREFRENHITSYIPSFKKCLDFCKKAALHFESEMKSIHEKLHHPLKIYIDEILKLHRHLTANPDENNLKTSEQALKEILTILPNTSSLNVKNDELLHTEAKGLHTQINVILDYIKNFFIEKEKIATMEKILEQDMSDYSKLVEDRNAVRSEASNLIATSNPYAKQPRPTSVKKKESSSSSSILSAIPSSTLQLWRNSTEVKRLIKNCLNQIEQDLVTQGHIKKIL